MAKLLKVAVVVLLFLSVASLVLGIMLFQKREALKGRTQKLERAFMGMAATIENESWALTARPEYPARDIDEITPDLNNSPRRSEFWNGYRHDLELVGEHTVDLTGSLAQLAQYYRLDPVTLKPMKDTVSHKRLSDGPGTMQEILDDVIAKSKHQLDRLNETRSQLSRTRVELSDTISDLNGRKQDLRLALNTVKVRDSTIADLHDTISDRDRKIESRDQKIVELNDAVNEREKKLIAKDDQITTLESDVRFLRDELASYRQPGRDSASRVWYGLTHGEKGKVAVVNADWNFVVLKLSDDFMKQYLKVQESCKADPDPDLTITREDNGKNVFVTKVKLARVDPERAIGVGNVLTAWQQTPIRAGDQVFY